jgi:hypothetical protein
MFTNINLEKSFAAHLDVTKIVLFFNSFWVFKDLVLWLILSAAFLLINIVFIADYSVIVNTFYLTQSDHIKGFYCIFNNFNLNHELSLKNNVWLSFKELLKA